MPGGCTAPRQPFPCLSFPWKRARIRFRRALGAGERKAEIHPPLLSQPRPFNYRFPETPKPEKTPSRGPKPGFYGDRRGGRRGKGRRGTNGCPVPNSREEKLPVGQRQEDFLCLLLQIPACFSPGPPSRLAPALRKKAKSPRWDRAVPRGG